MSDHSHDVVYLVSEVRRHESTPLRVFPTWDAADAWRAEHVHDFEELGDGSPFDYHVGMGAEASFPIQELPWGEDDG